MRCGLSSNQTAYSTDGINWTAGNTLPSAAQWRSVTYANGVFVTISTSRAAYSTDGINWTAGTMPSGSWYSVGGRY